MKGKINILVLLILCSSKFIMAQDHIFSQFFNAPVYLNPALTGQFEGDIRLSMVYRNQWSAIRGDLSYINAAVDINIPKFGGGVGLMFNRSSEGTAYLTKNNLAATYAYSVGGDEIVASFGIQAGITNRQLDFGKLVFSDQIDPTTGYIPGSSTSAQLYDISNKFYFDAAAGVNIVYRNLLVGAAVNHINQPDESFTATQAKLPMRIVANASLRIPLSQYYDYLDNDGAYLIPSIVYYKQASATSVSAGAQMKYRSINLGLWYRSNVAGNGDAVVVSMIFDIFSRKKNGEKLRLGLSHDATLSKINYTNTSGSTEASVGYEKYFPNSSSYNKYNGLRCYDFY